MATHERAPGFRSDPSSRGGVAIESSGEPFDAVSLMDALGLLIEPRGMAAKARFHGAFVDSRARVSLFAALPPASARLERVRARRAARSFAATLAAAGIPATLVKREGRGDAQSGVAENS